MVFFGEILFAFEQLDFTHQLDFITDQQVTGFVDHVEFQSENPCDSACLRR